MRLADSLQGPGSDVIEGEPRGHRERASRLRDQDLAGPGLAHDARGLVHRDATEIVADGLDLADVHTGADAHSVARGSGRDRGRAPNRLGWRIERREHAVPGRVDLASAEALELPTLRLEVLRQHVAPRDIADALHDRGRVDDVGEQQRDELSRPAARAKARERADA